MSTPTALSKSNPFKTASELEPWESSIRLSPIRELERMQREMNRYFNTMPFTFGNGEESLTTSEWLPAVDITEDDKEFVVKAELPEVKKEDVKVTLTDDVLCIRGERKAEKEEKNRKYHRIERSYGSFERSFSLPEAADASKISSEFKDGMLTVHLPKNPNAKSKTIEVKVH